MGAGGPSWGAFGWQTALAAAVRASKLEECAKPQPRIAARWEQLRPMITQFKF